MNRDTREVAAFVRIHSISHVITRVLHTPQHFQMLQTKAKFTKSWVCFAMKNWDKVLVKYLQAVVQLLIAPRRYLRIYPILDVKGEATSKFQALIETQQGGLENLITESSILWLPKWRRIKLQGVTSASLVLGGEGEKGELVKDILRSTRSTGAPFASWIFDGHRQFRFSIKRRPQGEVKLIFLCFKLYLFWVP